MVKLLALTAPLFLAVAPTAPADATQGPLIVVTADRAAAPSTVQLDAAKKAWFEQTVTDILEGRVGQHSDGGHGPDHPQ